MICSLFNLFRFRFLIWPASNFKLFDLAPFGDGAGVLKIEYEPYKSATGEIIDENRFKLSMNDGNTVYIDTANIKRLNQYLEIYASLNMETVKGVLYLDTITEENILFESYESAEETNRALEQSRAAEEEQPAPEPQKPANVTIDASNGTPEEGA